MKKCISYSFSLLLAVTLILSVGKNALAAITFNPEEPQPINTEIAITCSVGDYFYLWFPDNTFISVNPCATSFTTNSDIAGDYTITECDSTQPGATCDSSIGELSVARLDPGFVSEENYLFTEPLIQTEDTYNTKKEITTYEYNVDGTIGTTTATTTYKYFDTVYMIGKILFGFAVLAFMINFRRKKK